MLGIIAIRTYFSDGTFEDNSSPLRRTEVQGIVYFHESPYRTLDYGHPESNPLKWYLDPSIILSPGDWLSDDEWEKLRNRMETDDPPTPAN